MAGFVRSLLRVAPLSPDDVAAIENVLDRPVRRVEAGQDIVLQGAPAGHAYLILDGWAYGYKVLPNRRRQIISYMLPGDMSDLNVSVARRMDHSIASLTTVRILEVSEDALAALAAGDHPRIAGAFAAKTLAAAAIQREWAVNLGQRSAPERIGHVLCELFYRLQAIGLTEGNQCFLPLTQTDLAETTGLSLVHVNKRLRDLRSADLIVLRGKTLTIPDFGALARASLFDADYLSLFDETRAHPTR